MMRPATSLLLVEHKELEVSETRSQVAVTSLHPLTPLYNQVREDLHSGAPHPQRNMHEQYSCRMFNVAVSVDMLLLRHHPGGAAHILTDCKLFPSIVQSVHDAMSAAICSL